MDKKNLQIWRGLNTEESVGAGGFEPPASRTRTVRATGLRYAPNSIDYT